MSSDDFDERRRESNEYLNRRQNQLDFEDKLAQRSHAVYRKIRNKYGVVPSDSSDIMPEPRVEVSAAEHALIQAGGHFTLGQCYSDAIDCAEDALKRNPTREEAAEALRIHAAASAKLEIYWQAVEDAEKALELAPDGFSGPVTAENLRAALPRWQLHAED